MAQEIVFNCLLIGEKSSGRASFLRHHIPRQHSRGISSLSVGIIMHPLVMNTSIGTIQFNIWDADGMHGKCLVPTDCAIIFESVSNGVALKTSPTWHTDLVVVIESINLTAACSDEPVNSYGDLNPKWFKKTWKKSIQLDYYNLLSLDSPHNLEKVFLWLSRKLLHDKKIEFFSYPVFLQRFFIKAQDAGQGLCNDCFCFMVKNAEPMSSTSSSSSRSNLLKENSIEHKGGGDFLQSNQQARRSTTTDEVDKEEEEKSESLA